MQILIAQAAHQRIAAKLAAMSADFDVLTLDADKVVKRDGRPVAAAEVDPEVFWLSRDIFWTGLSPTYWDRILKGRGAK